MNENGSRSIPSINSRAQGDGISWNIVKEPKVESMALVDGLDE